ncbi:MAG: tetratricopeptide repeat protein [Fibrobacteria bacterium]
MLGKVWKRISEKRPRGAKLMKIVGAVSAMVWITAFAIFFLLKNGPSPAGEHGKTETVAVGSASDESGQENAEAAHGGSDSEASETASGIRDAHEPETHENAAVGHAEGGHADAGQESGEGHAENGGSGAEAAKHDSQAAEEKPDAADETGNVTAEPPPTREEFTALRQVAELYAASGDMKRAVTPMRRVMRIPTQDASLLALAADVFLATGNYQEALGAASQLLAANPGDIRVTVQAVEAQYRLGRVDKAFADAKALLKSHPGELTMLTTLGGMEVERGPNFPGYGKSLSLALKLKPDYAPALYQLGRKSQLEGNYKDAESAFRKVIKHEPQNAKAHGQLGMALYHLGKQKEAEKEYRAELAMNPEDYNTWYNLGELQLAYAANEVFPKIIQGYRADAMECFLKSLEINPDVAEAHFRVGVLLNGNGQYKEAVRHLEAALRLDSRHVPTLVQLSLAFENLKQPERARSYMAKAYELDPFNKVVLFKLKQWS